MKAFQIFFTTLLVSITVLLQAQNKKQITPADYDKWGELMDEKLSPDGRWVCFRMNYDVGSDTLFLQEVGTGKRRQTFVNGTDAEFSADSRWFLHKGENHVSVKSLDGKINDTFAKVKKYVFDVTTGTLAVLRTSDSKLFLYQERLKKPIEIANVQDYTFSTKGKLAISSDRGTVILDNISSKPIRLFGDSMCTVSNLTWNDQGTQLAFFRVAQDGDVKLGSYDVLARQRKFIDSACAQKLKVSLISGFDLYFSPEGERIFLYAKSIEKAKLSDDSMVQVWNTDNPSYYEEYRESLTLPYIPKLFIWDIANDCLKPIVPDSLPTVKILPKKRGMLAYNIHKMHDDHLPNPLADYYFSDLNTGYIKLALKAQSTEDGLVRLSPNGADIVFYNGKDWNIYNSTTGSTRTIFEKDELTAKMEIDYLYHTRCLGFTTNGRFVVLRIGYDFWLVSAETGEKIRMTQGKESKTIFNVVTNLHRPRSKSRKEDLSSGYFNLNEGIFFQAVITASTTMELYKFKLKTGLVRLYKSKGRIAVNASSQDGSKLLLTEQSNRVPSYLSILDTRIGKTTVQYQSNAQYSKYGTPKAELVSYADTSGKLLNGVLHYPTDYVPGKKYPLIVHVYEMLSQYLHTYNNPSLYSRIGFETANYTNSGYFVLRPDITYTLGDPGTSILDCVLKAVNEALKTGNIDSKRIGITGQSFGGFETTLLLTRTNIFATAVAGSAPVNLISSYLSLNEVNRYVRYWRFESHQFRMKSSLYENMEGYIKNSPVMNADKIKTPLLSWAGKEDGSVDWSQGVEMYLALNRLRKKNIFLVYPNEGHIMYSNQAKMDLTTKIKDWFDYYLKGEKPADWILEGTK